VRRDSSKKLPPEILVLGTAVVVAIGQPSERKTAEQVSKDWTSTIF